MSGNRHMILHRHAFVKAVESALRRSCGVSPGDRIVAAVSGGADSVAMLRALAAIAERKHWALDVHVAHVHHHLRDEADADAAFVADLARSLDLPCHRADIRPADAGGNLEAAARHGRYAELTRIAAEIDADHVATAHHADDQLETMLMRLIRGTSISGLMGIRPRRRLSGDITLIRPMLGVDHAAAVALLSEIGQPWREDATNRDASRWRAKLRAEVLPVLRAMRPDAAGKANDTARRLADAAAVFDHAVRHAIDEHVTQHDDGDATMHRAAAREMPTPILRGVVRRMGLMMGAGSDAMTAAVVEPITAAARDGGNEPRRFELHGGISVEIDAAAMRWKRPAESV